MYPGMRNWTPLTNLHGSSVRCKLSVMLDIKDSAMQTFGPSVTKLPSKISIIHLVGSVQLLYLGKFQRVLQRRLYGVRPFHLFHRYRLVARRPNIEFVLSDY